MIQFLIFCCPKCSKDTNPRISKLCYNREFRAFGINPKTGEIDAHDCRLTPNNDAQVMDEEISCGECGFVLLEKNGTLTTWRQFLDRAGFSHTPDEYLLNPVGATDEGRLHHADEFVRLLLEARALISQHRINHNQIAERIAEAIRGAGYMRNEKFEPEENRA